MPFASSGPKRLKEMTPPAVAAALTEDSRLILPIGTCLHTYPELPAGCATLIVERLADDLSAEYGVVRAPAVEYGVNRAAPGTVPGYTTLHKKTLHRLLNDLLASWEEHGVTEFILLTAHGYDPHLEALSTVATLAARVRVVDVFSVHFQDVIHYDPGPRGDRSGVYHVLLRYLAPESAGVTDEARTVGAAVYERISRRVGERIFLAPTPLE